MSTLEGEMSNLEGDTSSPSLNVDEFLPKNKLHTPEIRNKFKTLEVDLTELYLN